MKASLANSLASSILGPAAAAVAGAGAGGTGSLTPSLGMLSRASAAFGWLRRHWVVSLLAFVLVSAAVPLAPWRSETAAVAQGGGGGGGGIWRLEIRAHRSGRHRRRRPRDGGGGREAAWSLVVSRWSGVQAIVLLWNVLKAVRTACAHPCNARRCNGAT